jgi:hypothetical protein
MRTVRPEKAAQRGRRRSRFGAVLATLATALLAGSFAGLAGSPVPAVAVASAAAAHGSAAGSGAAAGSTTLATTIAGHQRSAIVHVRSGYTGQALIPDGTGFDWNVPGEPLIGGTPVPAHAANDVTFLTQLVGVLEHPTASIRRGSTRPASPAARALPASSRAMPRGCLPPSQRSAACATPHRARRAVPFRSSPSMEPRILSIPTAVTARPTGPTPFRRPPRTGRARTAAPPPRRARGRRPASR